MTVHSPEPNRLEYWLRRLWPVYCFLAALVTFGYALYDPFQIDGDATAYMDIGDLIRAHNWHGVINGYWNPLYPAALALGHILFHPTRFTELHAYYMVNFGIFLLEMLAIVLFAGAITQFRDLRATATELTANASFLLDRYLLRYLALALLVISSQRELSLALRHMLHTRGRSHLRQLLPEPSRPQPALPPELPSYRSPAVRPVQLG